ncbi:MFS transporter [Oerskovia jenensis]|uniref:MFS family permease n=1 Tax=Oerskovia jenensis TaxID=162169 RepID=A0ABS2LCV7_9CELL|nr:MFS transporter [Oerskovia jenensis]MBM7478177.1 MFS family permease [Oerskovia jenensis]
MTPASRAGGDDGIAALVPAPLAVPSPVRRARRSATAAYAAQGFGFAVMLTNVPTYERYLGIGPDVITLVILGVCVCAATGSALSGWLAARCGSARVVTGGLLVAAAGILAVGLSAGSGLLATFFLAFAVYGLALGSVDASTSMQGIDVQRAYGRSLIAAFFAANAAGGVVGSLAVSGAAALGLALPVSLALVAAVVAVTVLVLRAGLLSRTAAATVAGSAGVPAAGSGSQVPDGVAPAAGSGGRSATARPGDVGAGAGAGAPRAGHDPAWSGGVPVADSGRAVVPGARGATGMVGAGTVIVLGIAMLAFPVADSAVSSWGSTFLQGVLGASAVVGPLGFGAYQATLICSRLLGDRAVERWGRVRVVALGGAVGVAGLGLVAVSPVWPLAVLGFAATGLGLGVVAPMAFSAAGDRAAEAVVGARGLGSAAVYGGAAGVARSEDSVAATRSDSTGLPVGPAASGLPTVEDATDRAVARLNVFTYVGAVLGGAMTGVFATTDALRLGFGVLAALALATVLLAGRFREADLPPDVSERA